MSTTPKLALPYIATGGQADPEIDHNTALNIVDTLLSRGIRSRNLTAPPAASEGDAYIPRATATGDWAGQEGKVAVFWSNAWEFYNPQPGWTLYVEDENVCITRKGTAWRTITGLCLFAAYGPTSTIDVSAGWTDVTWDTEIRKDSSGLVYSHAAGAAVVTLEEAGDYLVMADVSFSTTGNNHGVEARLDLAGTPVAGSNAFAFLRSDGLASVSLQRLISNVTAGQALKVQARRAQGASSVLVQAANSRLTVIKVG